MGPPLLSKLSRKQVVGLVYVGISIVISAIAAQATEAQIEWFASTKNLGLAVDQVRFSINDLTARGFALVNASLQNPSSNTDLGVLGAGYIIFVNSTTENFSIQGSSEVVGIGVQIARTLLPDGTLSLNANLSIHQDLIFQLEIFLLNHRENLRIFVQITINLESVFGPLIPSYCYEVPNRPLATCPQQRTFIARGGGGG